MNSLSYFLAIPIPFGLFTKGLAFFDGAIDVDKINFLYLYADRTKTFISGFNYLNPNSAFWTYGVYSQFLLPANIRMNIDYYVTTRGTYQIYEFTKNRSSFEVIFSKDFLKKKLKTSISIEDVFNTSQSTLQLVYPNLNIGNYSKNDTRIIWFKLSYSFGRYEKSVPENEGPPLKPNVNEGL